MKKKIITVILVIAIILVLGGIGFVTYGIVQKATLNVPHPIATMEIKDYGTVKIELYPEMAPNTVANFIRLANRGYYDGLTFHRTIPDFMIQGGSKNGNGDDSPKLSDIMDNVADDREYNIKGEFIANDFQNTLRHEKGVISMARGDYGNTISTSLAEEGYNSAGSQFFITTADDDFLNGNYAGFGKVIEGYDIIEKIQNVEVYYRSEDLKEGEEAPKDDDGNEIPSDKPKKDVVIESISVETYGIDYGVPETIEPFDVNAWYQQMMQQYMTVSY